MKKALLILGFLLLLQLMFAGGWAFSSGDYSNNAGLTISASDVSGTLTDFPVLITEDNLPSNVWSVAQSDGDDIVFSIDGSTQLSHEKVFYNTTTNTTEIWVKLPYLNSTDGASWTVYYGNSTVGDSSTSQTWSNNFVYVAHLQNSANATDSSPYSNHPDIISAPFNATGKIGQGVYFNASGTWYEIPDANSLDMTSGFTSMAWVKTDFIESSTARTIVSKRAGTTTNYQHWINDAPGSHTVLSYNGASNVFANTQITNDTWTHTVLTQYNSTYKGFYYNGILDGTSPQALGTSSTQKLYIGNQQDTEVFSGILDEIRISNTTRSANWINTTYTMTNNPANFISVLANDYTIEVNSYNSSAYELTYQNFGIIISFNDSVVSNVTWNELNWNGTSYNASNQAYTTNTSTFNYTGLLMPLLTTNSSSITAYWNWTLAYSNGTNYTILTYTNQTLIFGVYTNSSLNATSYIEGETARLTSTVNNNTQASYTIALTYDWNATNYSVVTEYYRDFQLPILTASQTINYTVYANVTYSGDTVTRSESQSNVTISTIDFDACTVYSDVFLNITNYWEDNATLTLTDLDMQLYYSTKQWNFSYTGQNYFEVCASPATFNGTVDADMYYEYDINVTHLLREHYLRNVDIDNTTYDVTIRSNTTETRLIEFPVVDTIGADANNDILIIQKRNNTDGNYFTVTHAFITSGTAYANIVCDTYYRFVSIDGNTGSTLYTSDLRFVACADTLDPGINYGQGGTSQYSGLKNGVSYSLEPNNTNNFTVLSVISITGTDVYAVLNVSQNNANLCNEVTSDTSGATLTCNLGNLSGVYVINVYARDGESGTFTPLETVILDFTDFLDYGVDALFGSLILILAILLGFLPASPTLSVVGLVGIMGLLRLTNLLRLGWLEFVSLAAIGGFMIFIMNQKSK